MGETCGKGISVDQEVIHEYFHRLSDHFLENSHHAPLERAWSIAQAEGHASIGKRPIRASESGLFLIVWVNRYLKVSRKTIKKAIKLIPC